MRWLAVLAIVVIAALVWRVHGSSHPVWDPRTLARMTSDLSDVDGKPAPASTLAGARKVLIYFSASWCPPCRKFTPSFVSYYKTHGGGTAFQVLFDSQDESAEAMQGYMREESMPWWGVRFNSQTATDLQKAYAGRGIPCLVLVDGHGQVLADSFDGGTYLGPQHVLDALTARL